MCRGRAVLHPAVRSGAGRGKAHSAIARLAPSPLPPPSQTGLKVPGWSGNVPCGDTRIDAIRSSSMPRRGSNRDIFAESRSG